MIKSVLSLTYVFIRLFWFTYYRLVGSITLTRHLEIILLGSGYSNMLRLSDIELNALERTLRKAITRNGYVNSDQTIRLTIIRALRYIKDNNSLYYNYAITNLKL